MPKKAFTLVELLIVITIIGILAVAFLPSIFRAVPKARDATRLREVNKIQNALVYNKMLGINYPPGLECIGQNNQFAAYLDDFGGSYPMDPKADNNTQNCKGMYFYKKFEPDEGNPKDNYEYVVMTHVEIFENANTQCKKASQAYFILPDPNDEITWCYAIFQD